MTRIFLLLFLAGSISNAQRLRGVEPNGKSFQVELGPGFSFSPPGTNGVRILLYKAPAVETKKSEVFPVNSDRNIFILRDTPIDDRIIVYYEAKIVKFSRVGSRVIDLYVPNQPPSNVKIEYYTGVP